MKINQHPSLSLFVILCALFVGCDSPVLHHRPSDQACMQWLDGQKVVVEKGLVFDDVWVVRTDEFTAFAILSVNPNPDGTATAAVQFEVEEANRGLRVEGQIVYRVHKEDQVVQFLSFTPTKLLKLGKW